MSIFGEKRRKMKLPMYEALINGTSPAIPPKRADSSHLPEAVTTDKSQDAPEAVSDAADLPEAAKRADSGLPKSPVGGDKKVLAAKDRDEISNVDSDLPKYPATPTEQPMSITDGYQPVTSPMSADKTGAITTVTPLRLLGDQSDWVDCPFCRRRVETRVERKPSKMT